MVFSVRETQVKELVILTTCFTQNLSTWNLIRHKAADLIGRIDGITFSASLRTLSLIGLPISMRLKLGSYQLMAFSFYSSCFCFFKRQNRLGCYWIQFRFTAIPLCNIVISKHSSMYLNTIVYKLSAVFVRDFCSNTFSLALPTPN